MFYGNAPKFKVTKITSNIFTDNSNAALVPSAAAF